jgi:hypothetical protein
MCIRSLPLSKAFKSYEPKLPSGDDDSAVIVSSRIPHMGSSRLGGELEPEVGRLELTMNGDDIHESS